MSAVLVIVTFSAPSTVLAQTGPKVQTARIQGIDVEGNVTIDKGAIINLSGLLIGDEIPIGAPSSKLAESIKSLWRRKQFTDVNIVVDRVSLTGVYLKIIVKEAPHVSVIQIVGNETVANKDILKAADKAVGDLISQYDLSLIQKAVKQLYDKDGKQFAKVDAKLETTDSTGYQKLIITIKESVAFYVKSVTISGSKNFTNSEIAASLENTQTKEWWQFWKSTKFDKKKYDKDKDGLVNFFRKNGFVDAAILRDSLRYNEADETVDVRIDVEEGNRTYIRSISFEGNLVYPSDFLLYRLGMDKGDVYNAEKFNQNLTGNQEQTDVASLYLNNGYLGSRLEADDSKRTNDSVDIVVRVREGTQYTIRRVEIEGNSKTKDKVIRRELFTRPGDFFSRAAIIRGIRSLGQLNYFNPEKTKPDVKPVDNTQVDILYKVEERSADTFNASVGYAGFFGVTGSIGITLNNFSIAEPLQGGGGQIFNFNWEFGGRGTTFGGVGGFGGAGGFNAGINTFNLGLTEPWLFDEPTTVGFNIFDTQQNSAFTAFGNGFRSSGASINIGRRFRWPDDFFRGDWILRGQYNQASAQSLFFANGLDVSVQQTISRVSIDNAIFPTDGSRFTWTMKWGLGAVGVGEFDYFRNMLDFDIYTPLLQIGDQNRLVFRMNTSFGFVSQFGANPLQSQIPPLERFFMGGTVLGGFGITPLRGYPDRSIGPRVDALTGRRERDDFGNDLGSQPTGGLALLTTALELRFAVTLNPVPVYVIAFVEGGNVWDNLSKVNPFELKRTAGLGARLLLNPIGLLGLDWGYGFDRVAPIGGDNGQPQFRLQFQFGR
jgi:outer membrane protein insertion porin family